MKVVSSRILKTYLPYETYVGYYKPETFTGITGPIEIKKYLHKKMVGKTYTDTNLFKLRMDALRAFALNTDFYDEPSVGIDDCSLKYTTVWAFRLVRYEMEMKDGRTATVDRKEYHLLEGTDSEYMYDELLGLK